MGAIHPSPEIDHQVVSALINEHTAYARLGITSPPFRTMAGASLGARDRTTASATARNSASDSAGASVG